MSDRQRKIDTRLFQLLIVMVGGIVVTQTLDMSGLTSNLYLLTFPLTIVLWARSVRRTVETTDLLVLATIGIAVVSVMINAAFTTTMPSFSYIKKLLIFAMTLLFLQTCCRIQVTDTVIRTMTLTADLLTIWLIFLFFAYPAQMYVLNGRVSGYLTFRFTNPNLTAMFLSCLYMMELYRLFTPEKWIWKVPHIAMAVLLGIFIILTRSRNVMLIAVMFTLVCVGLILRRKKRMRIGKNIALLIALFPAIFVLGYVGMIRTQWVAETFDFLIEEGKDLDSRMKIWIMALENVTASPWVGAYSQISYGTGMSQMHNTHLDVACSYGVPVLILVCVLLWRWLEQHGRYYTSKASVIYMLGFACALLMGIGEAALFSGGLGLHVFVGGFLLMANHQQNEEDLV